MSVRRLIVEVDPSGLNVTEFCVQHDVSNWFFYELRRRFAEDGEAALEPKSRAPKTVANRTPGWIEDEIVRLRKELGEEGWDNGPATIWTHLQDDLPAGTTIPSEATIWRILTRRGFITPEPKKAPKHAYRSFTAGRANECWQIDDIEYELADATLGKVITILDDHSRLCVGLKAVETVNGEAVFDAFTTATGRYGWPAWFLADNAKVYKISLAEAVAPMGVDHRHGRPYHPQTQGKVERFHWTLRKWLQAQPKAASLEELQTQVDTFRHGYNHQRKHRAIGRRTPADVWEQAPKAGPADRPLAAASHIHRVTVTNGVCHINKQYSITIGAAHNGHQATVIITGLSCHVFIAGRLIRQLQLNPNQRHQALYDRPGRP